MQILFSLLFSIGFSGSPNCQITKQSLVEMPPNRSQDSTGFCYGFSATALIQHYYCKSKPEGCSYTETKNDSLSAIDVILIGNYGEGGLINGGNSNRILERVNAAGAVAPESCAPFSVFINHQKLIGYSSEWAIKVKETIKNYQAGPCPQGPEYLASQLKTQLGLRTSISEINSALNYRDFSISLGALMRPKACESNRTPLPKFKLSAIHRKKDFADIEQVLSTQISKGIPVIADLCAASKPQVIFNNPNADQCGLHSLVVSGTRESCCGQKCHFEYKFYDSGGAFNKQEKTADGWVTAETFKERMERKWQLTSDSQNLLWLEKP